MSYELIPGKKYNKLARVDGSGRSVLAFIDRSSGQYYYAQSWSQRGRMMTNDQAAEFAALLGESK